jgi:coproporphyrinogen III oxidase-like Fe-S oxidoreductase
MSHIHLTMAMVGMEHTGYPYQSRPFHSIDKALLKIFLVAFILCVLPSFGTAFSQLVARRHVPQWCRHSHAPLRRREEDRDDHESKMMLSNDEEINRNNEMISQSSSSSSSPSPIGLYIHIPYCRRRCRYCDFAIVPIGVQPLNVVKEDQEDNTSSSSSSSKLLDGFYQMDQTYRSAILKELQGIQRHNEQQQNDATGTTPIHSQKIMLQSIYFGGGTPSLAPIETIAAILEAALGSKKNENGKMSIPPFELAPNAELSIEMDPGTFTLSKLQSLKELGFNRISLGVQSFDDTLLEQIGRTHRNSDVLQALALIHQVFGPRANFSIDLISGLPGLTLAKWVETLNIATSLTPRPSHLSIYDLQVERGTVFGKWYYATDDGGARVAKGTLPAPAGNTRTTPPHYALTPLPSQEDCAFMYKYAAGYLRSKQYEHYEVSSYAFKGYDGPAGQSSSITMVGSGVSSRRSRHNQVYWNTDGQWYAIGLGATSSVGGIQVARPKAMADYIDWVDVQGQPIVADTTKAVLSDDKDYDRLSDIILKRLRTSDGLDLDWVQDNFGPEPVQSILAGANLGLELGLAEMISNDTTNGKPSVLRLVDPNGLLYSNYIISSIFVELGVVDDDDEGA